MRGGHAIENRVLDFRIAVGVVETLVEFWHLSIAIWGWWGVGFTVLSLGGFGLREETSEVLKSVHSQFWKMKHKTLYKRLTMLRRAYLTRFLPYDHRLTGKSIIPQTRGRAT